MRLLELLPDGSFCLTTFDGAVPRYAILSHTWGRGEHDEVTFKDLVDNTGQSKKGFKKLQFCSEQAREHGLKYTWVDTCCIDKSSSSELTEAINSMFRWYQQAERCYVYLTDVSVRTQDGQLSHAEWVSALRNSRWFTRGWTLQELLAPQQVEFYSRDRARLGDRTSLIELIHDITRINREALRGRDLSKFSIEERLGWATGRQTTKEEDMAYALLGICNVFMPLLYGEGHSNAMRRLRREIAHSEAQQVRPSTRASSSHGSNNNELSNTRNSVRPKIEVQSKKHKQRSLPKASKNNMGTGWSLEEDERLLFIVTADEKTNWKGVANGFPNRSPYACQKRFEKLSGKS